MTQKMTAPLRRVLVRSPGGCKVVALAPCVDLALDGNPETCRRMEAEGVEVRTYRGEELSRKGDGGPTCLTRPLARG